MSRIILIPLALLLLLVVAAAVLIPLLLDEEKVLEIAAAQLQQKTGATLTVQGETSLSLFPVLGVSLSEAALTMPGEQETSLQVRALSIGVQMMPLLSGSIEIDSIRLDGLEAKIVRPPQPPGVDTSKMNDQELDAFYAERRRALAQGSESAGAEAVLAVPMALNVQQLMITDSRVEMVAADTGESSFLELVRLEASGLNLDEESIPLAAQLRIPGEPPLEIQMNGNIRINQQTQIMTVETLTAQVAGATTEKIDATVSGTVDLSRQVADLQLRIDLGPTRGNGSLRYAGFESPQIDTVLQLNLLDPALLALAGPEAATAAQTEAAPTSGDEPLPLDAIRNIDTRAALSVEQAVFDAHTVSDVEIRLRAVDGVIAINTFTGNLHGGELDLTATFNGKHNTASLVTAGTLAGLDIANALAAMESEPLFTGGASLDWKLDGKGRTSNELLTALSGPINLSTAQPMLKGMSVEHMLCQAVALVNQEALSTTFPTDTRFTALGAALKLGDGKVNLSPLNADLAQVRLTGTGVLDLFSGDFKTTFKAKLSPELEELDKACRVSKRLVAIDWPVKCKGNTSEDPAKWCGVDTQEIIEDLAKNEAQRTIEKEAGKLLDKFFK